MQPRRMKAAVVTIVVWAACLTVAWGQQPQPGYSGPEFRDPKTGQVWTPDNVGQDGKPVDPADRAFDPSGQAVVMGPPVQVLPTVRVVGAGPVTAGPTVPLVEVGDLSLHTDPDGYWRARFRLQNNSAVTQAPEIACVFHNGDRPVAQANVSVPPTASGDRIEVSFVGPRSLVFVDGMDCRVAVP